MKETGCLCLHGFTGAPFEVEPLADYLRLHTDWEIAVPTLPGHGEGADLKSVCYKDWIACAEESLRELFASCKTVYVVGFSMGGIIACHLASRYPVDKLVLLSAAAKYISPKQIALDTMEVIKDSVQGNLKENDLYLRYTNKIKKTPLYATAQFRELVAANAGVFADLSIPVFIAQGRKDGIVPVKTASFLCKSIASEYKIVYIDEDAKHLICHSPHSETLFKNIKHFLCKAN
ncbi:MAG: alpha/beta hydrolase [Bacillus sp. (in: firmicutes)]